MARRVLITGVSRHLAGKLAQRLERDPNIESIVGVDLEEPEVDLERTEYVRADLRNPLIVKIMQTAEVDTVVHLNVIATPTRVGGRSAMKEINVIGSLQLFAACQKVTGLERLVMKSTTAVYGASPHDPAIFTEDMGLQSAPASGYARDAVEVEQFGYVPRRTTREALEEFVSGRRLRRFVTPERAERWEQEVYDFLRRKQQERAGR